MMFDAGATLFHEFGMPPSGTADHLFVGVDRGDFYIFSENPGTIYYGPILRDCL